MKQDIKNDAATLRAPGCVWGMACTADGTNHSTTYVPFRALQRYSHLMQHVDGQFGGSLGQRGPPDVETQSYDDECRHVHLRAKTCLITVRHKAIANASISTHLSPCHIVLSFLLWMSLQQFAIFLTLNASSLPLTLARDQPDLVSQMAQAGTPNQADYSSCCSRPERLEKVWVGFHLLPDLPTTISTIHGTLKHHSATSGGKNIQYLDRQQALRSCTTAGM